MYTKITNETARSPKIIGFQDLLCLLILSTLIDPAPCRSPVIPQPKPNCHHRSRRAAPDWRYP
ncbi:hypothetical protein EGJ55_16355 [Pseudomonas moraviensis]|nr:hypothetical protein EGJ55_16355 [Pseudomonas moraviensis]